MTKKIDETGNVYGRLKVLKQADKHTKGQAFWECECSCGTLTTVLGTDLRKGHTQSCGCLQKERSSDASRIDEIGNKYGKLVILNYAHAEEDWTAFWNCQCDCGNTVVVSGKQLRYGKTKSCGCLRGENSIAEVGNRHGRLLVTKEVGSNIHGSLMFECVCNCGIIIIVSGSSLRSGNTQSCGCYNIDRVKETHTIHGETTDGRYYSYPPKWTRSFRESIRERDSYTCQICGTTEVEENKSLSVHHIDHNKQNTTKENCISLCNSCHSKTNYRRKYWKRYFKKLKEKKGGKQGKRV